VPSATGVLNVNGPLLLTLRSSPPLSRSTSVPDSPETAPPIEYVRGAPPAQLSPVAAS
jgi:hypothetical protein